MEVQWTTHNPGPQCPCTVCIVGSRVSNRSKAELWGRHHAQGWAPMRTSLAVKGGPGTVCCHLSLCALLWWQLTVTIRCSCVQSSLSEAFALVAVCHATGLVLRESFCCLLEAVRTAVALD